MLVELAAPTHATRLAPLAHLLLVPAQILLQELQPCSLLFIFLLQLCVGFEVLIELYFDVQDPGAQLDDFAYCIGIISKLALD